MNKIKIKNTYHKGKYEFFIIQGEIEESNGYVEIILMSDNIKVDDEINLLLDNGFTYRCSVSSIDYGFSKIEFETNGYKVIEYSKVRLRSLIDNATKGEQVTIKLKLICILEEPITNFQHPCQLLISKEAVITEVEVKEVESTIEDMASTVSESALKTIFLGDDKDAYIRLLDEKQRMIAKSVSYFGETAMVEKARKALKEQKAKVNEFLAKHRKTEKAIKLLNTIVKKAISSLIGNHKYTKNSTIEIFNLIDSYNKSLITDSETIPSIPTNLLKKLENTHNELSILDDFKLNLLEYLYVIKLLERRINLDILHERNEISRLEIQSNTSNKDNFITNMYSRNRESKARSRESILEQKITWLHSWKEKIYVNELLDFKEIDIIYIKNIYDKNCKNPNKTFLILQEALLNPIYFNLDSTNKNDLKEINFDLTIKTICGILDMTNRTGQYIISDTDKYIKDYSDYWSKMALYGVIGSCLMVLTAGVFTPAIAVGIGGTLGYSGAAAYTAGLALLGGGSIALGGAGLAGGTLFIMSTGAILGGFTGIKVSTLVSNMSKEYLFISMIKLINYINFLKEENQHHNKKTISKIKNDFIDFKSNYEKDIINENVEMDSEKVNILNYIFLKLK